MKNMKKCLALLLALLLALSLAACGGDNSPPVDEPPASLEDMVKDSSIDADYSGFLGTWMSDDSAELIVEPSEDGDETRFALYGADGTVEASGYLQYMEEYGYVYAYNEHDGVAHQCWFDENNSLSIDSSAPLPRRPAWMTRRQAAAMPRWPVCGIWTAKPVQRASSRSTPTAIGLCPSGRAVTATPLRWTAVPFRPTLTMRDCIMRPPPCLMTPCTT